MNKVKLKQIQKDVEIILKVVAIDDDPIFRFLITELLDKCGIQETLTFEHGEEALTHFQTNKNNLPDLLLLDLNMPIMDGWDLLDVLRNTTAFKSIDIWVLSSSDYPEDLNKAKTYSEVSNVLIKPVSLKTLRKALKTYTETESTTS